MREKFDHARFRRFLCEGRVKNIFSGCATATEKKTSFQGRTECVLILSKQSCKGNLSDDALALSLKFSAQLTFPLCFSCHWTCNTTIKRFMMSAFRSHFFSSGLQFEFRWMFYTFCFGTASEKASSVCRWTSTRCYDLSQCWAGLKWCCCCGLLQRKHKALTMVCR